VALVGLVGIGKSRLAVQAAESLAGELAGGVRYVDLLRTGDLDAAAQAVLSGLGGREVPGQGLEESLVALVSDSELLLVLDSCERTIHPVAELSRRLLSRCPRLRILAVGTQRLGFAGEDVYRLPALAVPPDLDDVSPRDVLQSEAGQLFAERAGRHRKDFRVDGKTAAAVSGEVVPGRR